jgi:flavin reductase (NADH)
MDRIVGDSFAQVRPAEYRALMRGFPTGVAVITALDRSGAPHGMTCTSLASVSIAPPVLLVCLNVRSGTLAACTGSGRFAVNLLHARARYAAEVFSSAGTDRFDSARWRPSDVLGVPWLTEDAFALAECVVADTVPVGDHVIVLGRVVNIAGSANTPLMYGLGQFATWQPGTVVTASAS